MLLIASNCFDCLSADPVKRIGLYPKSRRRRAIKTAELALRPVTRVIGRSLLCEPLHLRTLGQNQREIEMLAEIFLPHLEATARASKEAQVPRGAGAPAVQAVVVGSSCEPAHPHESDGAGLGDTDDTKKVGSDIGTIRTDDKVRPTNGCTR